MIHTVAWLSFFALIGSLILIDLGVLKRRSDQLSLAEAVGWSVFWIALAGAFNAWVYWIYRPDNPLRPQWALAELAGRDAALQFLAGFLTEKSLAIHNVFVIAMVFAYFQIPPHQQRRLLQWGLAGAVLLRVLMIGGGLALVQQFPWFVWILGGLLILSALKVLVIRHDNLRPEQNVIVRWVQRHYAPASEPEPASRFTQRIDGKRYTTPLLAALAMIGTSDVMFAIDSVPAAISMTRDPYLVITSNVFAMLGWRSLYLVLAGVMDRFRYLKISLALVLVYAGIKSLIATRVTIPITVSLTVIAGLMIAGSVAAVIWGGRDAAALRSPLADQLEQLLLVTWRQARRALVLILGSSVVLVGVAMIVLPGPAVVVIPVGLGILAIEFAWARRWLRRVQQTAVDVRRRWTSDRKSSDQDSD